MKYIVLMFEMDDDDFEEIASQDMHGNDLVNEINSVAVQDYPGRSWHFDVNPTELIDDVWDKVRDGEL